MQYKKETGLNRPFIMVDLYGLGGIVEEAEEVADKAKKDLCSSLDDLITMEGDEDDFKLDLKREAENMAENIKDKLSDLKEELSSTEVIDYIKWLEDKLPRRKIEKRDGLPKESREELFKQAAYARYKIDRR